METFSERSVYVLLHIVFCFGILQLETSTILLSVCLSVYLACVKTIERFELIVNAAW